MRIGIDLRLAGTHDGGIATYARQLARWMPSIDPRRDYVAFGRAGKTPRGDARVYLRTPPHHRFERLGVYVELLRHRLDLFHSPDFVPPLRGRYRRVITVQDLAFLSGDDAVPEEAKRYYGRWIRTAVAEADAIIAISNATKDALVGELGVSPEKIRVTYLGRDERLRPLTGAELVRMASPLDLEPGYLLCVASFEWRKNHELLLDSYAQLRQRMRDAPPLVIAGYRGPTLERVGARVEELSLGPHVHLFVDVPADDIPRLHAGASIFALLSLDEGFGLSLVDAMACARPCVVSKRGALPEVAAGAAVEIESMMPEEVAFAFEQLLGDSTLRQDLGARALERSRRFSWERTARDTVRVYDELLGTRT